MSYEQNLGRVKGDTGTVYIPQITIEDGKQYISYTSNDGTEIPASLQKQEFASKVYVPSLTENGHLYFTLQNDADQNIDVGYIIGPTGHSTIGTKVVSSTPIYNELPQSEKDLIADGRSLIYVIDNDGAYLDSGVFEIKNNEVKFVYFENKVRFNDYYLKTETYSKAETYSKNEIESQLGNITAQQNAIVQILGDTSAIQIPKSE